MAGLKVAVLMGGTSFERGFSLESGKLVCAELEKAGHEVLPLDADENLIDTLREEKPDVAFVCIHGAGGEDGIVPSLLEFLRIPFVGSRPAVCRTAWNKADLPMVMGRAFDESERVASWPAQIVLPARAFRDLGAAKALEHMPERLGGGASFPLAVKPARGGSAMGLTKVWSGDQLGKAILDALAFDDTVVIQPWISGCEVAVVVTAPDGKVEALDPVEVVARGGMYDTESRIEHDRVSYFYPVRSESLSRDAAKADEIRAKLKAAALEVFSAYGCRDLARVDMIWDGEAVRILDLKVFPGLMETAIIPQAIEAAGLELSQVLDGLIRTAYERGA